jgi:hypothetical protein
VTVTQLVTQPTVSAGGLSYYQYFNPSGYGGDDGDTGLSSTNFNNTGYAASGTIQNLDAAVSDSSYYCTLPDGTYFYCYQASIVFQGYFYAAEAGLYTFEGTPVNDNFLYMWHGDTAYSAWDDSNYDFQQEFPGDAAISLALTAGQVLPVTFLWTNTGGPGRLALEITTPDGTVYDDTTGFFVPACAGSAFAP